MHGSPAMWERSRVRSDLRDRALMMVASLGEAYPNQLAKALRIGTYRLHSVLHGRPRDGYSEPLALVRLGLVEIRQTPIGPAYGITARGLRKARQLTARRARRAWARASIKERAIERVGPQPGLPSRPAEASPVHTSSFRWSIEG